MQAGGFSRLRTPLHSGALRQSLPRYVSVLRGRTLKNGQFGAHATIKKAAEAAAFPGDRPKQVLIRLA
jgi:hypothetical protein